MSTRWARGAIVVGGVAALSAFPAGQAPDQASLVARWSRASSSARCRGFEIERMNPPDERQLRRRDLRQPGPPRRVEEQDHPRILLDNDKDGIYESEKVISEKVRNCQGLWFDGPVLYAACAMVDARRACGAPPPQPGGGRGGPNINNRAGIVRLEDTNGDDVSWRRLRRWAWPARSRSTVRTPSVAARRRHLGHRRQQRNDCGRRARSDVPGPRGQGRAVPASISPTSGRARARARTARSSTGIRRRRSSAVFSGGNRNAYDYAYNLAARRSCSTATWSGTSACRGTAKCGRRTRSSTGTWLQERIGQVPAVLHRLAAADARPRPRLASRRGVLHELRLPREFFDNLFEADWSRGRLLYTALTPSGATYTARDRSRRVRARRAVQHHRRRSRSRRDDVLHDRRAEHDGRLWRLRYKGTAPARARHDRHPRRRPSAAATLELGLGAIEKVKSIDGARSSGASSEKLARNASAASDGSRTRDLRDAAARRAAGPRSSPRS